MSKLFGPVRRIYIIKEYSKAGAEGKKYFDELMIKYLFFRRWNKLYRIGIYDFVNTIILRVNGKTDASTAIDMPTQLLLGYMPVLYHKNPKDILYNRTGKRRNMQSGNGFP
jgi:hypothetical protein